MSRVWLITGANRGLGRAFAKEAVEQGDQVVACARNIEPADAFYQQEQVLGVQLDVTKSEEVKRAVQAGLHHFGHIDILLNNAGFGMSGAFEETSDEELRRLMETDYFGVAAVTREVIPHMRSQQRGIILNVASQGGLMGFSGSSAYCSAKFAVVGLSEVLHTELAPFGIQVSAICPGSFRTDFRDASSLQQPVSQLEAYKATGAHEAAKFLKENNHKQAGDPAKAARFLYQILLRENLPSRILIGESCCTQVKTDLQNQLREIESYEADSSQTDY